MNLKENVFLFSARPLNPFPRFTGFVPRVWVFLSPGKAASWFLAGPIRD